MLIMPNDDLVLLGESTDTSLIDPGSLSRRKFLAYFSNDPAILNYRWAIQLPVGLETNNYKNIDYSDDSSSSQLVIMFSTKYSSP